MAPRFPVIHVLGVAHCGSTLFGRMVNRHSQVLCVGELMRVDLALQKNLPCGCDQAVDKCDFWAAHLPRVKQRSLDYRKFDNDLYTEIGRAEGAETVVDLSKTRAWRRYRFGGDKGVGYVLLVRDSRGVVSAALRKGKDLTKNLAKHKKWMRRLSRFAGRKQERALVIYYEDLCRDTERELKRFCAWSGIDFEEQMLRPADATHHFVHSSASKYLQGSNEISLDERWRRDLEQGPRQEIERVMRQVPLLKHGCLERSWPS